MWKGGMALLHLGWSDLSRNILLALGRCGQTEAVPEKNDQMYERHIWAG